MRRDNVLIFAVLCVFHAWTGSVDSTAVTYIFKHQCIVEGHKSMTLLTTCIAAAFKKQKKSRAEGCAKDVLKRFQNNRSDYNSKELPHDHIKAICAYSGGEPKIHDEFNKAVLSKKNEYSSFEFHSLHFLLTDALRRLKENQNGCLKTFRRTKNIFLGEVNKEIRFGFFASSSTDKGLSTFGEKSCFEIETCFGADLKSYPRMGNIEKEVLIPPYEVFKVTEVLKKENDQNLWCDVVYKLQSTKTPKSNLNCKLINIESLSLKRI
uniref:NAD(P)(+)--arginine ADP-ribosyltransferase n=1 Tax=Hucho hucho TaxID=62062 RepID=A0A4W5QA86_9TELE